MHTDEGWVTKYDMVTLEELSLLLPPFLDSNEEYKGFRSGGKQIEKTVARFSGWS